MQRWRSEQKDIAFVPTMGALHQGHLSLVESAKKTGLPILTSVFVNPTQFEPHEDFNEYPRDREGDCEKLKLAGVDAVFFPNVEEIYPHGEKPNIPPLPLVFSELEGAIRPNHFLGVAQVLFRFFTLLSPSDVFFGQKDYQQTVLVQWLVDTIPFPTKVHVCPIIREESGLAMSSRNAYLKDDKRKLASILFRSLAEGKALFGAGERDPRVVRDRVLEILHQEPSITSIDYVNIRDAKTFEKIETIETLTVLLLAVRIGNVRLIDNMLLKEEYLSA